MRHLTAVSLDELIDFLYTRVIINTICSGMIDWSLNTSADKKIIFSFDICKIVFHLSLWLKLSIFFSLVLFSLEMHNRSGKKLTRKN